MEVSALKHPSLPTLPGSVALLRLQSDERLVALVRRGHHSAFEALVARYQARLLAFCRHMLSSREDAEDVLQEVFA
ncbi:MAG TPA: sigma factor, partial [Solirubrobacteraceae bacterium]|nr:sigma factor [Solirubrobacteraceae bacterium]